WTYGGLVLLRLRRGQGSPGRYAHLLRRLEPGCGHPIDLRRRLLEQGSRWVVPIVRERDRAQIVEALAAVVVVEGQVRGPDVDPGPPGLPLADTERARPVDQRGPDAMPGEFAADDEPRHVHGILGQLRLGPERVIAVLAARDGSGQHAWAVLHDPGQAVLDALPDARIPAPLVRP